MMNDINIGVVSIALGPYAAMGEDGFRGAELAVAEAGGVVAGKKINLFTGGSNAMPDSAVIATETLLDKEDCAFVVGPMSGNEGMAVRDFAKTRPKTTFINGNAAAQDITLRDGASNFFSFVPNGAQYSAGLAEYAYRTHGYRRVVTIGEDYSYPHAQIGAFIVEFCRVGGQIVHKFWVPLGKIDFRPVIAALPEDIDAIYVCLAGADAINFILQYAEVGGRKPLIAGSVVIDQVVLSAEDALAEYLVGTISSGPIADNNPNPDWQAFVNSYRAYFPYALPSPSLIANAYYTSMKAALLALDAIGGDLSDNQQQFQQTLRQLEFMSPTGLIRLDHHQHAIANNFIMELVRSSDGSLYNRVVQVIPQVNQTLGLDEAEYLALGSFTHDNPPTCG
jgi:branched-chain amino acid transport system substrate-binding protein